MNIHPELVIDWCEGCVCNICRHEWCHVRTVGNLWICNSCLQKQKDWWWDSVWGEGKIRVIKIQLEITDYSGFFRR